MVMGPDTDPLMSAPFGKRAGYVKDSPISAVTADVVFKNSSEFITS